MQKDSLVQWKKNLKLYNENVIGVKVVASILMLTSKMQVCSLASLTQPLQASHDSWGLSNIIAKNILMGNNTHLKNGNDYDVNLEDVHVNKIYKSTLYIKRKSNIDLNYYEHAMWLHRSERWGVYGNC